MWDSALQTGSGTLDGTKFNKNATDATGTILWLVGRRIAHPFRVTDAAASILRIASIQYKVS